MSDFWQGIVTAVCTNGVLLALVGFWLHKELQRHQSALDRINNTYQTRHSKYHIDAVDAIVTTYGLLVDLHNSVFRYCFPDWDPDSTLDDERKRLASENMVAFYEYFRKHQILMEEGTIGEFEKSFRFLQEVYSKKDVPAEYVGKDIHVAMSIYADMTKTLPGMLQALKSEIKRNIGPEQSTGE